MGRAQDVQQFVESLRHVCTPLGLERLISDIAVDMGFDIFTMYHHVDLSRVVPTYRHMHRGELVGISTAPVAWSEHYRDNNFVVVDPRVLACRRTVAPFRTDEMGRLIQITSAQRAVAEGQQRANIGESFTIPIHFPGEPTGSCTFSMKWGRALPIRNLAMAHWIGSFAFQAGRTMLMKTRARRSPVERRRLTERQLQCTILVGRGLSEEAIGKRLGIATETVKRHLKEARLSYGATKSVQLVTQSLRDGQITLRDIFSEKPPDIF